MVLVSFPLVVTLMPEAVFSAFSTLVSVRTSMPLLVKVRVRRVETSASSRGRIWGSSSIRVTLVPKALKK